MKPETLISFRTSRRWTQLRAAAELGCARTTLIRYEAGEAPIPLTIALAAAAVAHNLKPLE